MGSDFQPPPKGPRSSAPSEDEGRGPSDPGGGWFFPGGMESRSASPDTTGDFKTPSAKPEQSPQPNDVPMTFGRYEVRKLHGQGGFGAVYIGFDPELHRKVAIKVPRFHCAPGEAEEFLQEARRLAQLKHPGIVTVYDVGVQDGRCYIISDFVEGMNLKDWLANRPAWTEAVKVLAAVAEALAHAHAHSTVHRDVKPANIMLNAEGQPILLDFGLALTEREATRPDKRICGTPAYMSPEQAWGEGHRIDGRTDIYSLGVILYEAITGRRPFRSEDTHEVFRQVREDEAQPPRQLAPSLPVELEHICLKAMAKQLHERYTTAKDLAKDLRQVVRTHLRSGGPPGSTGLSPSSVEISAAHGDLLSESMDAPNFLRGPMAPPPPPPISPSDETNVGRIPAKPISRAPRPSSSDSKTREAERRQVTVLFCTCDAADNSAIGDPEDQHELLLDFQKLCADVVAGHQGTIVQSTGQGVLVCFGYPQAFEDAAQRAVRTGLGILHEATRHSEQRHKQRRANFSVWLTIHSGLALVGEVTPGQGGEHSAMVGEARNVATRLESIAEPNTLVISEATHRLVQGFFVCESLGAHAIKGLPQPVETFRVVRATEAQTRIESAGLVGLTPLVGRDFEVGLLRERWEQAKEGMGQIVLLIGEPGIGKSRLVHVIKEHVAQEEGGQPQSVVEWRCSPYYQNSSLNPATDFFERSLGLQREDPAPLRLGKLAAHLERYGMGGADVIPLFADLLSIPYLDRFPPLNLSPQRQKDRTLEVLLEWTRQYAKRHPMLFIIDDLHWVDPTTLEFLGMVVAQGFVDRVLTLLTFRPEFTTPWTSRAHQTQVALNRLTRRQIADLMQRKSGLKKFPPVVVDQVAARTDGVPLFVEEFTKMLMESGAVREVQGEAALSGSFPLNAIPTTLHDLLMARVDRMAGVRDVIQLGATLGREFPYELLHAALGLDGATLQRELNKLVEAEILYPKGKPPTGSYLFKHALIQDAAYQSLVKAKRQQFHKTIAHVLEQRFPATAEAQPELLAHHCSEAGLVAQAVNYWEKAAKASLQRSANAEAIEHFHRGLEQLLLLDESPERDRQELGFQVPFAMAIMTAKGWAAPDVEAVHNRARQLCEKLGDRTSLFFVLWGSWAWRLLRVELDTAKRLADELLTLSSSWNDAGFVMEAHWAIGCTSLFRGEFPRSHEHFQKTSALLDAERCQQNARFTGQNVAATLPAHWGWTLWHLGLPDQALRVGLDGVALSKGLSDPFSHAFAIYHLGCVQQLCHMPNETLASADATLAIAQEQGFAIWKGLGTLCRGAALSLQGKHLEGADLIRQGLAGFQATGAGLSGTHYFCRLAEALLNSGRLDEASRAVEDGLQMVQRTNERFAEAELYRLKGEVLRAQSPDKTGEAEQCFQRSLEVARVQGAKGWELRAARSLAELK